MERWFLLLSGALTGLALGSFTTMLSYRLPRRISIVSPRSQCPHCHTPLRVRELVPVISYLIQRGRCRMCDAPIGMRYVLIELTVAIAVTAAFVFLGLSGSLIIAVAAIVALVTAAVIRLERHY